MAKNQLTPRQAAFVREYLIDLNATQAAIRAGYSEKTANRTASENLSKPDIAAAIQAAQKARAQRTEITADRVVQELAKLAFANLMDYFSVADGTPRIDLRNITPDQAAALTEITVDELILNSDDDAGIVRKVKIKMADKRASLELLGRHFGIFSEKRDDQDGANALRDFLDSMRQRRVASPPN